MQVRFIDTVAPFVYGYIYDVDSVVDNGDGTYHVHYRNQKVDGILASQIEIMSGSVASSDDDSPVKPAPEPVKPVTPAPQPTPAPAAPVDPAPTAPVTPDSTETK